MPANLTILTSVVSNSSVCTGKYGGHKAVTRSLVEGLKKIGYDDFNYQPEVDAIAPNVHVLSGVDTLRWAIELKKLGRIKRLTAGPNIVVFSSDENGIIADSMVDLYLQPSQWGVEVHELRNQDIVGRCKAWPAGVNLYETVPKGSRDSKKRALIYRKFTNRILSNKVAFLLKSIGYEIIVMEYGYYKFEDYISALDKVDFVVTVGSSESQGLYMVEAWAKNIPTFCLSSDTINWNFDTEKYSYCSNGRINVNAPYLCEANGRPWKDLSEFCKIMENINELLAKCNPRKWVEENMSDEVCARKFLELVLDYRE